MPYIYFSYYPDINQEGRESFYLYTNIYLDSGIIDVAAIFEGQERLDLIFDYNKNISNCEDYNDEDFITCEKAIDSLSELEKIFNAAFENIYVYNDYHYNNTEFLKKYMDYYKIGKLFGIY